MAVSKDFFCGLTQATSLFCSVSICLLCTKHVDIVKMFEAEIFVPVDEVTENLCVRAPKRLSLSHFMFTSCKNLILAPI